MPDVDPYPSPVGVDTALLGARGAGLLLDLDGTLLDSEPVHQESFRQYFAGRGWFVTDTVIKSFAGQRAQEVFAQQDGPWAGEDPEVLTTGVLDALRASSVHPAPVAGAVRLIAACARAGLPVAIVTSARRDWAEPAARLFGPAGAELPMVTAEVCVLGKPDPEPFRRGVELLGLRAGDLVAAEDSAAGIASARSAGVGHVIGITTSQPAAALLAAGATETAPDLEALARAVEALPPRA